MNFVILVTAGAILLGIHLLILKCWFNNIEEVIRELKSNQPNPENQKSKKNS